jgi:hypothetical protein
VEEKEGTLELNVECSTDPGHSLKEAAVMFSLRVYVCVVYSPSDTLHARTRTNTHTHTQTLLEVMCVWAEFLVLLENRYVKVVIKFMIKRDEIYSLKPKNYIRKLVACVSTRACFLQKIWNRL